MKPLEDKNLQRLFFYKHFTFQEVLLLQIPDYVSSQK
jgi:hypothetical protein